MYNACWLLLLKNSTLTSQRPLRLAAGGVGAADCGLRFCESTEKIRSATILSSLGCICQAVIEMEVAPGSLPAAPPPRRAPPPPPPPPSAILGLVVASSSAT